jgi:PAS domain S-box-containing protein
VDKTERVKIEALLEQTRQNYETFFNTIDELLFVLDDQGNIVHINTSVIDRLGYAREELVGKSVLMVHPTDRREEAGRIVEEMLNGVAAFCPVPVMTKSGVEIPVETRITKGIWDGKPAIFGVTKDISRIKFSEEKFSRVFYLNPSACGLSDIETMQYFEVNDAFHDLLGFDKNEVIGKTAYELGIITEESRNAILKNANENGRIINAEAELTAKNGEKKYTLLSAEKIRVQNRMYRYTVVNDITAYKLLEKERKKSEQQQLQAQKLESLGVLAGGIAHDFNNMLTTIFGNVEVAAKRTKDDQIIGFLEKAMKAVNMARGLTSQMLTFAKGGAPKIKTEPLFPFVYEAVQFALSGSNVAVDYDVADNLPPVKYDRAQVSQVINNIVINALQAMPNGGRIEVHAHNVTMNAQNSHSLQVGNYVNLSIKDQGMGMTPDVLARIFEPFFTTKKNGQGLGLATCFSIICRHGGCIFAESELNKGSVFHILLPAAKHVSPAPANVSVGHRGRGVFLVMDNDCMVRETMGEMLKTFGYSVEYCDNGQDAIAFFLNEEEERRELAGMILDLTNPGGMGGKDAVAFIRKTDTIIPIFAVSGYADEVTVAKPEEFGFTAGIYKPFTIDALGAMLDKYLTRSGL